MKSSATSAMLVITVCAILTVCVWAVLNQPVMEPPWPETLQGVAFSPYHENQDAVAGITPSAEEIDADLTMLEGKIHAVRTYTSEGVFAQVPELAAKHKINVTVGAWIDQRLKHNDEEIDRAIKLSQHRNVVRVIVGNEVLLRNDVPIEKMFTYLDRARKKISRPVSTAETWHTWMQYPELADHVDFIAVHILPFWEGLDVAESVKFVSEKMDLLKATFPDKEIVIGEVGWPSEGRTRYNAVASESNEALFLRRFFKLADHEDYIYYVMEVFDQPWKIKIEGAVGAYWGIYDVQRQPKFPFNEPIVRIPEWQTLAGVSVFVGIILLSLFSFTSRTVNTEGKTFLALIVYTLVTVSAWVIYDYTNQYLTNTSIAVGILMLICMLGIILCMLSEAHEWIEAHWISGRRRVYIYKNTETETYPKVSVHVPAYNEPPDMMIETLNALADLDYPNFEVIVIDNNTKDETVWKPVEAHCALLGERFKFFHVDPLSGFKAGALNYAMKHTAADVEILAYIDSDYVVDRSWLKNMVPAFNESKVAIVQAPQDYRDAKENAFKAMCYAEYRGFFHIGMITRNDRNAIIQHGTMTMVRKSTLDEVGGWAEWCITEDAELGLRVFQKGYEAHYTSNSYGRGLIPDTFIDYKKQRHRWAYGSVQIIKKHARTLFLPGGSKLSAGQRYHFVAGWLPWFADGANLIFNMFAILWSVGMMYKPQVFEPPLLAFSVLPITFFMFKMAKLFHLYRQQIGASMIQTIAAAIAGLSLTHTIGQAMLYGLFTNNQPFIRTPKRSNPSALTSALTSAYEETLLLIAFVLAILTLKTVPHVDSPDYHMWIALMGMQCIPYGATLLTSLISVAPIPSWLIGQVMEKKSNLAAQPRKG